EISQADLTRVDVCEGVSFCLVMIDQFRSLDFATRFLTSALRLGERDRVSRALALECDMIAALQQRQRAQALLARLEALTREIGGGAPEARLAATPGFLPSFPA